MYNKLMNKSKPFLVGYKLFFALLGFSALLTEVVVLLERNTFNPANFFSFFTIESNMIAVIALLASALYVAAGKHAKVDALRAAATVYIVTVGLGFSILLAGIEGVEFTAVPWDNIVLHYLMPIALLVDFLIDPPKRKLPFKRALVWLLFPIAYLVYSLIRGAITGWYPYPFLNPSIDGLTPVAIGVSGIVIIALAITWIVTLISGNKRAKRTN